MRRLLPFALLAVPLTIMGVNGQSSPKPGPIADVKAMNESLVKAFDAGDAKALAAMYTANGEMRADQLYVGTTAIEKAYSEYFKTHKGAKLEIIPKAVRYPAKDMMIEEGLLRVSMNAKDLPRSNRYVAIHVREDGQWKTAFTSEAMDDREAIEDLEWLAGEWGTKVKDEDVTFTFRKHPTQPLVGGEFRSGTHGGMMRIALDPEMNRIRSWAFEDDGAHSQGLWKHDGKSWLVETRGVLKDGTPFSETIVLQRVEPNVITWRAVDRFVGEKALPDTSPMRLTKK